MNSISKMIHGNAIVVHGQGLLILGDAHIGKSELCLELLYAGHALIADDAVEIIPQPNSSKILMNCPKDHFKKMVLLDVGLIDLSTIFQPSAFVEKHPLDRIIILKEKARANPSLNPEWFSYPLTDHLHCPAIEISSCRTRHLAPLIALLACYKIES